MDNRNFHRWFLKKAWRYFGSALVAAGTAYISTYFKAINVDNAIVRLSFAQAVFLLVSIFLFARVKCPPLLPATQPSGTGAHVDEKDLEKFGYTEKTWDVAKGRAERSVSQFRKALLWTLAFWSLLYVVFCFQPHHPDPADPRPWALFTLLADLANFGSNAGILACYIILAENTTDTPSSPFAWLFLIVLIGIIELLFIVTFSLDEKLFTALTPSITLFGVIGGLVGSMVVGLFVGQLDNKHLDCPIWLLAVLFGYAAIQPLYPILQGVLSTFGGGNPAQLPPAVKEIKEFSPAVLISLAGVFKFLLCLFLYHSFTSGRLLFYCARTRTITDSVDAEWEGFEKFLKKPGEAVKITDGKQAGGRE
jgi:hypothetical protein